MDTQYAIEIIENDGGTHTLKRGPEMYEVPEWVSETLEGLSYRKLVKEMADEISCESPCKLRQWLVKHLMV